MDMRRESNGRPPRSPRRDRLAIAAPLLLLLAAALAAPSPVRAGPIRDRAQAIAARDLARRALLQPGAGTLQARAAEARNQAFQLRRESILNSEAFRRQEAFYARALEQGMARVPRPQYLDVLLVPDTTTGLLPDSTTIDYLQWRRSLNTARFDRNHPMIAPILERDRIVRNQTPIPLPTPQPPTTPGVPTIPPVDPTIPTGPILGNPPSSPQVPIPEPGAVAVWVALGIGGAFALNRRRRQPSGSNDRP